MFRSAVFTYSVILVLLLWWVKRVCQKESARRYPAEEAVFNVKRGPKKICGCDGPCACVSNTQAKRAAKMAKAQSAERDGKSKSNASTGRQPHSDGDEGLKDEPRAKVVARPKEKPTHAKKVKRQESMTKKSERFDVIELGHSDNENAPSRLPQRWTEILSSKGEEWARCTDAERHSADSDVVRLIANYKKLQTQRKSATADRQRPLGENKFAVFEDSEPEESESTVLSVLGSSKYNSLAKIELLGVLIQGVKNELYRLSEAGNLPAAVARSAGLKARRKAKAAVVNRPNDRNIGLYDEELAAGWRPGMQPKSSKRETKRAEPKQEYIPGLPVELL